MISAVLALGLVVVCMLMYARRGRKPINLPSPPGLPILGNLLQTDREKPQLSFDKWAKECGDECLIHLLGERIVIASGFDSCNEILGTRSNDYGGRPPQFRGNFLVHFNAAVIFSPASPKFIFMKKKISQGLKTFGENHAKQQEIAREVLDETVAELLSKKGTSVNMLRPLFRCVANSFAAVIYGSRLTERTANTLLDLERPTVEVSKPFGAGVELDVWPWIRFLPSATYKKLSAVREVLWGWILSRTAESKSKYQKGANKCLMDYMFETQEKSLDPQGRRILTDGDLNGLSGDLIMASLSTTAVTLYSFIGIMATKLDIQRKVQKEVDELLGMGGSTWGDRSAMHYTEACILETLRFVTPTPVPAPHYTETDTFLGKTAIPKHTQIIINLWSLHHDERYWEDPWEFKPERFLAEDGTLLPPDNIVRKRLLAFGGGRRICVGEVLARNRMFNVVTSLLQKMTFLIDPEHPPNIDPRSYQAGFTICPQEFNVRIVARADE